MSVRLGILALLAEEDMYGAQLRAQFETRTGGTWPLNIGQVYTTLARLERDGLVSQSSGPDEDGRIADSSPRPGAPRSTSGGSPRSTAAAPLETSWSSSWHCP